MTVMGLPCWLRWLRICLQQGRPRFDPWVRKMPWRMAWQPTPVFLLGDFPWTAARHASLSFTTSWSLLKLISLKSVMPSNHLILCHPLLLLPLIFPSIRVFSNESALHIRWPKYWSFSFSISPSNEYSDWFPLGLTGLISLWPKGL